MSSSLAYAPLVSPMHPAGGVELIDWPISAERRAALHAQGVTRLYLVAPGHLPPDHLYAGEQWVRQDADAIEVHWRIRQLAAASCAMEPPSLRDGCLVYRGAALVVPPSCERMTALLCDRFGSLVERSCLQATEHPVLTMTTLNTRIHRLRQLLADSGLVLTGVRGRGYVLHAAGDRPVSPAKPAG